MTDFLLFGFVMFCALVGAAIGYTNGSRLIHVVIGNAIGYAVGSVVLVILIVSGVV